MLQLWFVANTILWPFILFVGGLQLSLNVVLLSVIGIAWLAIRRTIAVRSLVFVGVFIGCMVVSLFVAISGPCNDLLAKFLATAPPLLLLILIGLEVGRTATYADWQRLETTATWVFLVALASFLLEFVVPSLFPAKAGYRLVGKYSGLFSEPSHVAFSLFPCIAVLLASESKRVQRRGLGALCSLLLLARSTTLIAFVVAWFLYRLAVQRRFKQAVLLALGMTALVALASTMNYEALVAPTIARIAGVAASGDSENNMSSLVYVQGWQDAWANLKRTHGLGLGFDMMGCHPLPDVAARKVLTIANLEELNAQDGSFIFSKVVSEAGAAGIAIYVAIIWWWVRLEKMIRAAPRDTARCAASIQTALIFCFVASSFLRGTGYFSGGVFLWIVAVSGAVKWRKHLTSSAAASNLPREPRQLPA